jgi:hypothetical protein
MKAKKIHNDGISGTFFGRFQLIEGRNFTRKENISSVLNQYLHRYKLIPMKYFPFLSIFSLV